MNAWSLPHQVRFGENDYKFCTDYRDILEIIIYLTNDAYPEYMRWRIAMGLFYESDVPFEYQEHAMQYLCDFIGYGSTESKPGPKLMDWNQDASLIVSDINKVAGHEIRALKYLHWWTFLSYFYGIGEGQLSSVVSIRKKKATGKKLEKWEQEYYQNNKKMIDFATPESDLIRKEKEDMLKWL